VVIIDCPVQNEGRISRTVNSRLMPLFAVRPHVEMTYIVLSGALNSTHSLTHSRPHGEYHYR